MRWGWLLIALFYSLSLTGCAYFSRRTKEGYSTSEQEDYEKIKQQKIKDHQKNLKRLRGKEPSQLY
jgi:hypothetical protein